MVAAAPGREGAPGPGRDACDAITGGTGRGRGARSVIDGDLVLRAQAGNVDALCELAGLVRPIVQRYASRFLADPTRAEDMAQTALMKAFSRVGDVRSPEAFHAWILRITRNECLNELSRQRTTNIPLSTFEERGVELEAPAGGDDDPEESLVRAQLQDAVRRVVAGLPDHYRRALTMRALEDRSYEEISEELHVPVPVARLWYCRARKRFRSAFVEAMVERRDVPDGCRRMSADIAEMIEGSLGRAARDRLQGHLADCQVCRQTEDELRNTAFRAPARSLLIGLGLLRLPRITLLRGPAGIRRLATTAGRAARGAMTAGVSAVAVMGAGAVVAVATPGILEHKAAAAAGPSAGWSQPVQGGGGDVGWAGSQTHFGPFSPVGSGGAVTSSGSAGDPAVESGGLVAALAALGAVDVDVADMLNQRLGSDPGLTALLGGLTANSVHHVRGVLHTLAIGPGAGVAGAAVAPAQAAPRPPQPDPAPSPAAAPSSSPAPAPSAPQGRSGSPLAPAPAMAPSAPTTTSSTTTGGQYGILPGH